MAGNQAPTISGIIEKQQNNNNIKPALSKYTWNDDEITQIAEHGTVDGKIIESAGFFIAAIMYHPVVGGFLLRDYRPDINDYAPIFESYQIWLDIDTTIFRNPAEIRFTDNMLADEYIGELVQTFYKNDNNNKTQFIRGLIGNISKSFIEFLEYAYDQEDLWTEDERMREDYVRHELGKMDGIPYFLIGKHEQGQVTFYRNIAPRWFFMTKAERDEELNGHLRNAILAAIMAASLVNPHQKQEPELVQNAIPAAILAASLVKPHQKQEPELVQNAIQAAIMAASLVNPHQKQESELVQNAIPAAILAASLVKPQQKQEPELVQNAIPAAILAASTVKPHQKQESELVQNAIPAAIMAASLVKPHQKQEPELVQNAIQAAIMAASASTAKPQPQPQQKQELVQDAILAAILASMAGNTNEKDELDAIRLFMESGILYTTDAYNKLFEQSQIENTKTNAATQELFNIERQIKEKTTEITTNNSDIEKLRRNPEDERRRIQGLIDSENQKIVDETAKYDAELSAEKTRVAGIILNRIGKFITAEKYPGRPAQADSIQTYKDFITAEKSKIQNYISEHNKKDHNEKGWEKTDTGYKQRLREIGTHLGQLSQNAVIPEERINIEPREQRLKPIEENIAKYQLELDDIDNIADKLSKLSAKEKQLAAELAALQETKPKVTIEKTEAFQKYSELTSQSKILIKSDKESQNQIKTEIVRKVKEMRDQGLLNWFDKKQINVIPINVYSVVGTENKLIPFFTVFGLTAGNNDYKNMAQILYNIYKSWSIDVMKENAQKDVVTQKYQQEAAQAKRLAEAEAAEAKRLAEQAKTKQVTLKQGDSKKPKARGTRRNIPPNP